MICLLPRWVSASTFCLIFDTTIILNDLQIFLYLQDHIFLGTYLNTQKEAPYPYPYKSLC
jgi:hypothetical protein